MGIHITRHIPNFVTCLNLFSGCIACHMAFHAEYRLAFLFILLSALFDFLDGMLARLLKAYSPVGKDLDSLADDVSFGAAPSFLAFSLLTEADYPPFLENTQNILPYAGFLICVFSALRLAKFNNDSRQASSFIGLPVPANALFWGSLATSAYGLSIHGYLNAIYLLLLILALSYLLVAEIPMFSLKFKNLKWNDNKIRFLFLVVCIPLLAFLKLSGFAAIIIWYILLSVLTAKKG